MEALFLGKEEDVLFVGTLNGRTCVLSARVCSGVSALRPHASGEGHMRRPFVAPVWLTVDGVTVATGVVERDGEVIGLDIEQSATSIVLPDFRALSRVPEEWPSEQRAVIEQCTVDPPYMQILVSPVGGIVIKVLGRCVIDGERHAAYTVHSDLTFDGSRARLIAVTPGGQIRSLLTDEGRVISCWRERSAS